MVAVTLYGPLATETGSIPYIPGKALHESYDPVTALVHGTPEQST